MTAPVATDLMVVLDAMGVMYQPGEDLTDLAIPFLRELGCTKTDVEIAGSYNEASLGAIDSAELWRRWGVSEDPALLDRRLMSRYTLTDGLLDFLQWCKDADLKVACISNDLGEWAAARAAHFGLTEAIALWTISGDVGHRKPDAAIYEAFLSTSHGAAHIFVDDKLPNVLAAAEKGMHGVLFGPRAAEPPPGVRSAADFGALTGVVEEIRAGGADGEGPTRLVRSPPPS